MEFLEKFLPILFMMVIIPSIGLLTYFIVTFIQKKKKELQEKIDDDLLQGYLELLFDTVTACVITTNQTYVNSLKEQGKFDAEAQREAFKRTYDAVMEILSEEAIKYLGKCYGDLESAVRNLIESNVVQAVNRIE